MATLAGVTWIFIIWFNYVFCKCSLLCYKICNKDAVESRWTDLLIGSGGGACLCCCKRKRCSCNSLFCGSSTIVIETNAA